ncbi:chondroitinase-B domain-containing protein [Tunicatimonas pelagia]|uniref:chondroitinase-B domain-containing protein n=1 Tax=Tunicatimonas pelagia TaxID=931531 RepID=UPI002665F6AD|nr:chondroitinase-B domain-containing protein [Tunicatimonas pelagia]WKN44951.1 chondroitinase-B domain-containing protein [Tunicatimonas pelagia]
MQNSYSRPIELRVLTVWFALLLSFSFLTGYSATYQTNSQSEAQQLLDNAVPGDVIIIGDGDYTGFMLTLSTSGTSDNPITLRAETGGGVNLTDTSGFFVTGDHIIIDGFRFTNVPQMSASEGRVVRFEGSSNSKLANCAFYTCGNDRFRHIVLMSGGSANNEISYNYLENIVGQGIGVTGEEENSGNHIHHNRINGTQNDGEFNGQEPIQLGQSSNQYVNLLSTLVEYNLIENMRGDADSELVSNKTRGNTIRFNTCVDNDTRMELVLRGGEDCIIESNYLESSGIRAYGSGHVIRNNYTEGARYGVRLPGGNAEGNTGSYAETFNCTVENNIIIGSEREGIRIGDTGENLGGAFIRDLTIDGNQVTTDQGTMFFLREENGGNINWAGNVGEGSATLKTDNITSGVALGDASTATDLVPLTSDDVGPDWQREGQDREPGTFTVSSAAEAQDILNTAVPGDEIIIANGDYADFMLTLPTSGTSENAILLRAQTGGEVTFTGLSGFFVTGDYVVIDGFVFNEVPRMSAEEGRVVRFEGASNSRLTNCAFYTCGNDRFRHIVLMAGGSANNEVSYNYLENIVGQGIGVIGEANNTGNFIHHNWINGTQDDGEFNGQEPIQLGQSSDQYVNNLNTLVEFNLIENMSDEDKADSELISNKTAGNTLRFNTTRNNAPRMELVLRGGEDCVIESNYLSGNSIRAYGSGHVIRNNYSENARYGVRLPGGDASGSTGSYSETTNCTVEGNLVVNSEREGIRIGDTGANLGGPFISDITISDNEVQANQGTMFFLQEPNNGNINWSGNVGEGSATLKTDNITSGVVLGDVNEATDLVPLTEDEVGPDWLGSDGGGGSDAPGIFLEAETCGTIGATWEVKEDPNASGGEYVEIADGNTSQPEPPTAPEDRISYSVEVEEAGRYALWGRVLTPSNSDDSFWVRVNGGDWQIWFTGVFTEWSWVRNANYDLTAGSNTIDIAYREDGSQLDKLYLTKDGDTPRGKGEVADCEIAPPSGSIVIRAKGSCGSETMVLEVDGVDVQAWTNVATSFTNYTYDGYSGGVIKVRFTNDGVDEKKGKKKGKKKKGCDRNLIVDKITVCGTVLEAENAIRSSCGPPSQWLWCNGNFDFGDVGCGNPPDSGTLAIRARGTCGLETMVLQIDGQDVKTWMNVSTTFSNYTYEGYSGGTIEVFFTNDGTTAGCDKNLIVDKITVCGTVVEAEEAVRSSCGPPSQWLWCNGSFNFGNVGCGTDNARIANQNTKGTSAERTWEVSEQTTAFETYPNPVSEHLTIFGPEAYTLSVYDLSGQQVLERSDLHGKSGIDVQHLQSGVYIIRLHGDNQPDLRQRLIIE